VLYAADTNACYQFAGALLLLLLLLSHCYNVIGTPVHFDRVERGTA
jgi:hypothetical protein